VPCTTPPPGYHGADWMCCPDGWFCTWVWVPSCDCYAQTCCQHNPPQCLTTGAIATKDDFVTQ
jgi:hypothetical protein